MKIILSRKGFDSGNGGNPSPIMPDGTPVSLPIPRRGGRCYSYVDLYFKGQTKRQTLSSIMKDLFKTGTLPFENEAHADPDLDSERFLSRPCGWRPAFGQTAGKQTHLKNQGVDKGDLFLFFGWFCRAEYADEGHDTKRIRYANPTQEDPHDGFHALFGWLQIGETYHPVNLRSVEELPEWLKMHPHAHSDFFNRNNTNTIYVASDNLTINGASLSVSGGGTFSQFTPELRLTKPGETKRTIWSLPKWFYPEAGKQPLSYHKNLSRWTREGDRVILKTVSQGQEFVLNTQFYPEALDWVKGLFRPEKMHA